MLTCHPCRLEQSPTPCWLSADSPSCPHVVPSVQGTTHCRAALYVSKAFQTGRGLSKTDTISVKWARTYLNTAVRQLRFRFDRSFFSCLGACFTKSRAVFTFFFHCLLDKNGTQPEPVEQKKTKKKTVVLPRFNGNWPTRFLNQHARKRAC